MYEDFETLYNGQTKVLSDTVKCGDSRMCTWTNHIKNSVTTYIFYFITFSFCPSISDLLVVDLSNPYDPHSRPLPTFTDRKDSNFIFNNKIFFIT